ncbi:MAG: hypothetical protein U1C74_02210 [Phenylobacterium sp.]|nr:hypothetical protein [Phenylobacterium sp.]
MPLNEKSGATMKLTSFRLEEIEEIRPGVFRHRRSAGAILDRLRDRWSAVNPLNQRPSDRA